MIIHKNITRSEIDVTEKRCDCKSKTKLIWVLKFASGERWCTSCGKTHEIINDYISMYGKNNWKQWYVDNGHHLK